MFTKNELKFIIMSVLYFKRRYPAAGMEINVENILKEIERLLTK